MSIEILDLLINVRLGWMCLAVKKSLTRPLIVTAIFYSTKPWLRLAPQKNCLALMNTLGIEILDLPMNVALGCICMAVQNALANPLIATAKFYSTNPG